MRTPMTPEEEAEYLKDLDKNMEAAISGEEEMEEAARQLDAKQQLDALKPHADAEQEQFEAETAAADRAIDATL
jgi:hypothetical protein